MPASQRRLVSPAAMRDFAQELAGQLRGGDILYLEGELGSGKTTFVQSLAAALGVRQPVTSPTFTVVAEYPVEQHPSVRSLIHIDLYRLSANQARVEPAVREAIEQASRSDRVTVIEWAEKLAGSRPPGGQRLQFQHGRASNERIVIT